MDCGEREGRLLFVGHTYGVTFHGLSPDNKYVVSGSADRMIQVWDIESGKIVAGPFTGNGRGVTSVRFPPNSKRVVSSSADDIRSSDLGCREWHAHRWMTRSKDTEKAMSVGISHDGKRAVFGSVDRNALLWDVENGNTIAGPFKEHRLYVTAIGCSPNSKHVVSGSDDGTVLMWDVAGAYEYCRFKYALSGWEACRIDFYYQNISVSNANNMDDLPLSLGDSQIGPF